MKASSMTATLKPANASIEVSHNHTVISRLSSRLKVASKCGAYLSIFLGLLRYSKPANQQAQAPYLPCILAGFSTFVDLLAAKFKGIWTFGMADENSFAR